MQCRYMYLCVFLALNNHFRFNPEVKVTPFLFIYYLYILSYIHLFFIICSFILYFILFYLSTLKTNENRADVFTACVLCGLYVTAASLF